MRRLHNIWNHEVLDSWSFITNDSRSARNDTLERGFVYKNMNQELRIESSEQKPTPLRERIGTDERFASLRDEIAQSVQEVLEQGLAMNITPLRKLMEKSLGEAGYTVTPEEAPSFFFDVAIKDVAFPKIYHAIENDIAERT